MKKIQLEAGACVKDITPPLEVGLLTSSVRAEYAPFESVRLPLMARVLALRSGKEAVAIVSLDLLGLTDTSTGGWESFKQSLAGTIPAEKIIINCTHTHNAPESCALSDLYLTGEFKTWLNTVKTAVKQAIDEAVSKLQPCKLSVAEARLEAHSLQRRIPTKAGIIMSDSIQPIAPALLLREPVDRRVHILALRDMQGIAISTIVHAVCHPVHEMCMPHISPDYPGELCRSLEATGKYGIPLFLNGAAGDINPPTVSEGPAFAQAHGRALAELVQNNSTPLVVDMSPLRLAHGAYPVNLRAGANIKNEKDALARLNVLCIGSLALVFLPGEFFVELAYDIEKHSPFEHTIVVGYAENNIGYVPTLAAFEEGGYEAGPGKWSFLEKEAGPRLCKEALRLLNKLYQKEVANINLI